MKIRNILSVLAVALLSAFAPTVHAWDGSSAGTIAEIDVTDPPNYGLRVFLVGLPTACTGGPNWSYLNETDTNYKTYSAMLMIAFSMKKSVTIYTTNVGGYCKIGYLMVTA